MSKTALITGVTGQDGSYLAELLLEKGYDVHGMVRRSSTEKRERIEHLNGNPNFHLHYGDLADSMSLVKIIGSDISARLPSKNAFRLYFGANTIWYLQFHVVCAKLFVSVETSFIDKSSVVFFSFDWQVKLIITHRRIFCSSVNLY